MSYTHKKNIINLCCEKVIFYIYFYNLKCCYWYNSPQFFLTNFMQTTTQCKQMTPLGLMIQIMWTLFVLKGYSTFFWK